MGWERMVVEDEYDWAMLFGMFSRMYDSYRVMGEHGQKQWAKAKILLFMLRTNKPASPDVLAKELYIKLEQSLVVCNALRADRMMLPVGYSEQMERGALTEKDVAYELTLEGRMAAREFIKDYQDKLLEEQASMEGWKLKGGIGVNERSDNYGLPGGLEHVPKMWAKKETNNKPRRKL